MPHNLTTQANLSHPLSPFSCSCNLEMTYLYTIKHSNGLRDMKKAGDRPTSGTFQLQQADAIFGLFFSVSQYPLRLLQRV